jgi:peptidoglycan/LPS O-acetylase OafA/YrhL
VSGALAHRDGGLTPWAPTLRRAAALLGVVGLALFGWRRGFDSLDGVTGTIGFTIFALGFGSLIGTAVVAEHGTRTFRFLASRPLRWLGRYSYGLYVFHHPISILLRDAGLSAASLPRLAGSELPGVLAFALVAGALSTACAVSSFHLWESPFLRLKRHLPYRPESNAPGAA